MGKPAARITDFHACPMVTPGLPPIPHVGGPVIMGSPNVITGKMPQARVGDNCVCVGPPDVIVMGSTGVFVNSRPAARVGDLTAHGGTIVVGCFTVLIGETAGGGGGGGGVGAGAGAGANPAALAHEGKAVQVAFANTMAQIQVLAAAAKAGTPFCEVCFQKAVGNLEKAIGH